MSDNKGEIVIYDNGKGDVKLEVRFQDENIWLTQQLIADLFQTSKQNIGQHLKKIFDEGELDPNSVVKKYFTTAADGKEYQTYFYNLDAIISVGYRVKSLIATRFRIWATQRLKEYLIKGFVMDDERLKNPPTVDSQLPDYFDEMLARIRDIRASERRMYLRVREIFAIAVDYELSSDKTKIFFSIIQNKLHFASTGMTAAEIIMTRADSTSPHMGLTNWQREEIRKSDTTIAKNYLNEEEIDQLNRIVVMWLDFAEDQAKRRKSVFMNDWVVKLDDFLRFNERKVLPDAGKVTKAEADEHAIDEYEKFAKQRREFKESRVESEVIKQLESTAKNLEKNKNKKK